MANFERVVVSPSLLKNLVIHPVSQEFTLGMEEWTDSYLESIERTLSDSRIDYSSEGKPSARSPFVAPPTNYTSSTTSRSLPLPLQENENSSQLGPPSAKKKCFTTLSKEELDQLSKASVPKNTESSTR